MGDLNGTLKDNECINYTRQCNTSIYSFHLKRMIQRTGLIYFGFKGPRFTWFKKNINSEGGQSLKRVRLDRALGNVDWRLA